jgi:hypothetical protein
MIDLQPTTSELADLAAKISADLRQGLAPRFEVLALTDLEPIHDVPADKYYGTCPERLECLQLLGDRSHVANAFMGEVFRRPVAAEAVQIAASMDTLVIRLRVLDTVGGDELPPITVEIVGDDDRALIEAVSLALEGPAPARRPRAFDALEPDEDEAEKAPGGEQAEAVVTREERLARGERALERSKVKRQLERGHAGQLLFRLSAGAVYGELNQVYDIERLTKEGGLVEEYSRLSLETGGATGLRAAVGYGLGRHLELEAQVGWTATATSIESYSQDAQVYALDPWTHAECAQGTSGKDCPVRSTAGSSALSLGGRARLYPSVRRLARPFVMVGASWLRTSAVLDDAASAGAPVETWWKQYEPIRTVGVMAGVGVQYELGHAVGLFAQLPVTWRVWTNQPGSHEDHYQDGTGPYFADLPPAQRLASPVTVELEVGVQLRLF